MAVSLRGTTQGVYRSSGSGTVAWPSGTVAGDLAVLALLEDKDGKPDSKPLVDGWTLRQSGPSALSATSSQCRIRPLTTASSKPLLSRRRR